MSESAKNAALALVRAQGAPKQDGYNPIAPRSHRWMMDHRWPEKVRYHGWTLWRTIDYDPEGLTGPAKKSRTTFAHDVRAGKKGHLGLEHAAEDLGMLLHNVKAAAEAAEAEGLTCRDEYGRIWPNGNAPLPERIKSEDAEDESDPKNLKNICTDEFAPATIQFFNDLTFSARAEYTRHYRAMWDGPERPFAEHLETLPGPRRGEILVEYLQDRVYAAQVLADAVLAARTMDDRLREKAHETAGFQREHQGRARSDRPLTVEVKVCVERVEYLRSSHLYRSKKASVQKSAQKPHPYKVLQSEVPKDAEFSGAVETEEKPKHRQETKPAPRPHSTKPFPKEVDSNSESTPEDPLIQWLEDHLGRKISKSDALRTTVPSIPQFFGITPKLLLEFWNEKLQAKQGYPIRGPGAWVEWTMGDATKGIKSDLQQWLDENAERVSRARREKRDFDIKALAAKKGMS